MWRVGSGSRWGSVALPNKTQAPSQTGSNLVSPSSITVEGLSSCFLFIGVRLDHQLAANREDGHRRNHLCKMDFIGHAFSTSWDHQLDWRG